MTTTSRDVANAAIDDTASQPAWRRYGFAIFITAATFALRLTLAPWIGERPVLILFMIPMILSAYNGGLGPGLTCTALIGALTAFFFMPAAYSLAFQRPLDFVQWLLLMMIGVMLSLLMAEHRASRRIVVTERTKYGSTQRKVQTGFALALACLALIGTVSYLSVISLTDNAQRVSHTRQVTNALDRLLLASTEAETAQRGYLIGGEALYLDSFDKARAVTETTLQDLQALTADNPAQQRRLMTLRELLNERFSLSAERIELRRAHGFEAIQNLPTKGQGRKLQEHLRAEIAAAKQMETDLLRGREERARSGAIVAQSVIIGGGLLAFGLVALSMFLIRRDLAARREAEAQLDRFFSLSLDFLCISSADGYFKRVSPAVTDILGWSVEEFLRTPYLELVHPEDVPATVAEVEKQIKTGEKVLRFENRYRHKDGSWRTLSWRSTPQPDGLMYATARDVTDLKHQERALQQAKEQLEVRVAERTQELEHSNVRLQSQLNRLALLSQITRAIGEHQDTHSIFQVVVRSLEAELPLDFACLCLYRRDTNTLTVSNIGKANPALTRELALDEQAKIEIDENGLSRCVRGALVYEPDTNVIAAPFPQRLSRGGLRALVAAPLLTESKVFGVLLCGRSAPHSFSSAECEFLRQVSEHVALATHQSQLHESLQSAYEELRQTQQAVMEHERLRVLGQMASGIAHDINNAISPISLYTETLLEQEHNLTERGRNYLQTIRRAIDDVAETVGRMREFYRQRETSTALSPLQLNALVPQVIELTRARWFDMPQQRGDVIELDSELAGDLPLIMGVESEIREALTNLIFNAVDAMPRGGRLTIRTSSAVAGATGPRVSLAVIDTGIGMNAETRARCLELFFTTKGERGTGLGLAMVYGIVQRHSGQLDIESEPGKGTCVRLSFAAARNATRQQDVFVVEQPIGLRILVVDDDPIILDSMHVILENDSHVVVTAPGGREGIDAFTAALDANAPFDIVITDLGMPVIDGRKVAMTVKAAAPSTAVLMLTGWGQRMVSDGETPENVDKVLSKPPKLAELRAAIAELSTFAANHRR